MQNYKCKAHTTRLLHLLNYPVFKNFYKQYNVFSFTYFIEPAQLVVLLRKRAWATGEAASSLNMNSGRFFSVFFSFVVREVRATPANPRRSRKWGGTGRGKEDLLHLPLPHLFSRLPFAQRSLNTAPPAPTKKRKREREKTQRLQRRTLFPPYHPRSFEFVLAPFALGYTLALMDRAQKK